jgi:hypothetical protein
MGGGSSKPKHQLVQSNSLGRRVTRRLSGVPEPAPPPPPLAVDNDPFSLQSQPDDASFKLVLLGAGGTGKSTLYKQALIA